MLRIWQHFGTSFKIAIIGFLEGEVSFFEDGQGGFGVFFELLFDVIVDSPDYIIIAF